MITLSLLLKMITLSLLETWFLKEKKSLLETSCLIESRNVNLFIKKKKKKKLIERLMG